MLETIKTRISIDLAFMTDKVIILLASIPSNLRYEGVGLFINHADHGDFTTF
jgi:hypothetical protein